LSRKDAHVLNRCRRKLELATG